MWGGRAVALPRPQLLRLRSPLLFPLPALPALPFRRLAPRVLLRRDQPPHIRSGEEVQYR